MIRTFSVCLLMLLAVSAASAQDPTPVQTPPAFEDTDVVKISANLIQIDVTATDKNGNPVKDLTRGEIEIYENGKKQEITTFSFVSSGLSSDTGAVKTDKKDKNAIPPPPRTLSPGQVRRTIALVVDDLSLSFESTHFVRRALRKYVDDQMAEGDLVAIIRTGAGIGALQQFTSDKRMLYAAIEKIRWNPLGTGGISTFAPIGGFGNDSRPDAEDDAYPAPDPGADLNELRESIFAGGTLGAINYVIRGMKDLPGRKSILLLSDGFRLVTRSPDGMLGTSTILDPLRSLIELANRSSVVIYTIDARGLAVTGITAADDVSELTGEQITAQISGRSDKLFDTQDGLNFLARETGGFPIFNNNDISAGIRKVVDDQNFYLIGYQPDEDVFDPAKRRFNKLEVKVKRPDVRVRYRSGFFGVSDEAARKPPVQTPAAQILNALASPFGISGINLSLNTVFRADSKYETSLSSFLYIDANGLSFSDAADGRKKAVFDLMAVTFGDNGIPVDQISKTYTIDTNEQGYRDLIREGFIYYFTFPIGKPGAYQMRVAIRDHGSEKLGSASQFVEVPKLKQKRLTLSGLVLENLSLKEWDDKSKEDDSSPPVPGKTTQMADTAIRTFRRGTILRYGYEIYNARSVAGQSSKLQMQTRLYHDGKVIFEGKPQLIDSTTQNDPKVVKAVGAIVLGTVMTAGDYVLQVIITDELAKKNYGTATQFVQFELIEQ